MKRFLRKALLALIHAYQRWISPLFPRRCRYEPTCSAYAAQAIKELGPFRGTLLAAWRLLRCNPLSNGGLDPLSDRRFFRTEAPIGTHAGNHQAASSFSEPAALRTEGQRESAGEAQRSGSRHRRRRASTDDSRCPSHRHQTSSNKDRAA
ncbi:MAG: uncharacterized protein QOJ38_923 [Solirubrobacterales bacterium]|nr:uncharacterized protein [Solirubrobacterales bacterium]